MEKKRIKLFKNKNKFLNLILVLNMIVFKIILKNVMEKIRIKQKTFLEIKKNTFLNLFSVLKMIVFIWQDYMVRLCSRLVQRSPYGKITWYHYVQGQYRDHHMARLHGTTTGVDVTAGPLACGQYIYGRASQTEQRSARWAS